MRNALTSILISGKESIYYNIHIDKAPAPNGYNKHEISFTCNKDFESVKKEVNANLKKIEKYVLQLFIDEKLSYAMPKIFLDGVGDFDSYMGGWGCINTFFGIPIGVHCYITASDDNPKYNFTLTIFYK